MKILLVTIIDNNNIGTCLQIYATVQKFCQKGHDVCVLNYIRDYLFGRKYALDLWKGKNWLLRYLFSYYFAWINRKKIFKTTEFLSNNSIKLTKAYTSANEIRGDLWDYDLYVTGSDQVWNVAHNNNRFDGVYFLQFSKGKKIAFSASIGTDSFPNEYIEQIKELLSHYLKISVREAGAVSVLNEIGIRNVTHVLDPTLLYSKDEWIKMLPCDSFVKTEPYLLIYTVEDNEERVYEIAKQIAKEKKLAIYQVSGAIIKKNSNSKKCFSNASPELFLRLVADADFMVVSSFHGTAFSVNFNKQFITVAPNRFNSRVRNLLRMFGLEERYVDSDIELNYNAIDYDKVNMLLGRQRFISEDFIDKSLKDI